MPFDRPSLRRRGPPPALPWACCAIAVSAVLSSCGGLAADGLEPEASEPSVSRPPDAEPSVVRPVRETCEDNPLLAGCPFASMGAATPPSPPAKPGPMPEIEPQYITRAKFVLSAYCGGCHGAALTEAQALGGINYISDWEQLIEAGLIERCSPESSRIVEVMRTGEMPPPETGIDAVSDADINVVKDGIVLDCRNR
jgi:hypothetical protein